jgi:hypothetical protein
VGQTARGERIRLARHHRERMPSFGKPGQHLGDAIVDTNEKIMIGHLKFPIGHDERVDLMVGRSKMTKHHREGPANPRQPGRISRPGDATPFKVESCRPENQIDRVDQCPVEIEQDRHGAGWGLHPAEASVLFADWRTTLGTPRTDYPHFMRHALIYEGAYELNFTRLIPGSATYVATDGAERPLGKVPLNVDGLVVGYMERAGKKFSAVRIRFEERDIVLKNAVALDPLRHLGNRRFSPRPIVIQDDVASVLLDDVIAQNAEQQTELALLLNRVNQVRRGERESIE